jgi:nitrate reductase assembly molybdenum cofactor insertion protein NarJ
MTMRNTYSIFADVFRYPESNYPETLDHVSEYVITKWPVAAAEFQRFSSYMKNISEDQREELYTKTFDVQPICYLDLGYVIFGEDYKRGAFLLHMQEEQKKLNNDCGSDLPDHLSNMLTLMDITEDQMLRQQLADDILIPGIRKMIGEFEQSRVELKEQVLRKLHKALIDHELNFGNVYRNALQSLLIVLESEFPVREKTEETANYGGFIPNPASFFQKRNATTFENNYKLD